MDRIYRNVLLPPVRYITRNDAEVAHEWLVKSLTRLQKHPKVLSAVFPHGTFEDDRLRQQLMDGLEFKNPFGTAAGFDKLGSIYPSLQRLTGAGHIELGGVTLEGQPGNERPRLVRVGTDNLINAMGFLGDGVDAMVERLKTQPRPDVPIGVQIVKQKLTAPENTAAEYGALVDKFKEMPGVPDYFVINVSSPNTPGLRAFQDKGPLAEILSATTEALDRQQHLRSRLLIKLSPDLERTDIETIIGLVIEFDIGGVILTNTTTGRPLSSKYDDRSGGFSGSALYGKSSRLVKFAATLVPKSKVLVATGGIDSADRAYEMLQHADLIGAYTGLVLKGPNLLRLMAKGVVARMDADGVKNLEELRADSRR